MTNKHSLSDSEPQTHAIWPVSACLKWSIGIYFCLLKYISQHGIYPTPVINGVTPFADWKAHLIGILYYLFPFLRYFIISKITTLANKLFKKILCSRMKSKTGHEESV